MAVREMLGLRASYLGQLPLPSALLCRARNLPSPVLLTTSRGAYEAARARRWPAFTGREVSALLVGAENDRVTHVQLGGWCARKLAEPSWDGVSMGLALSGMAGGQAVLHWTVERLLQQLGMELLAVAAGDEDCAALVRGWEG